MGINIQISNIMRCIVLITLLFNFVHTERKCVKTDIHVTQNVEDDGFHRVLKWLIELSSEHQDILFASHCRLALKQDIPAGIYVNPDEIADLNRVGKILAYVEGKVNVETPMHLSEPHSVYVYHENSTFAKVFLQLPIHVRYQRAQIIGGFGRVQLSSPTVLIHCPDGPYLCSTNPKVEAPCNHTTSTKCQWNNVSHNHVTNNIELLVPIGDLDHYPIVSIVTFLVACAGCIYILSILSTTIL